MNIWSKVDDLVDESTDPAGLQVHGLDLYAAHRWRTTGRAIPDQFLTHERAATMAVLALPTLLAQIRDVLDGPVLVMKGPEVATYYPHPSLRPFRDLDLLVPDAETAHRALIAAGWAEINQARLHHPAELLYPGTIVPVEVHTKPNCPWWTMIDIDEIFARAMPSALAIDGVQTPSPYHHAVLLAAHSWQHEPFRRLIDLIDIALMTRDLDAAVLEQVARRWGLGRVWQATTRASDALFDGAPNLPLVLHLMSRHCRDVRQRTALESRIAYLAAGMWAPTAPVIAVATAARVFWPVLSTLPQSWTQGAMQHSHRLTPGARASGRIQPSQTVPDHRK